MTDLRLTDTQHLVLEFEDALTPLCKKLDGTDLFRIAGLLYRLKRAVGLPGLTAVTSAGRVGRPSDEEIKSRFLSPQADGCPACVAATDPEAPDAA